MTLTPIVAPLPAQSSSLRRAVITEPINAIVVVYPLSPPAFALAWCMILGTRCICALFLLICSRTYAQVSTECMAYYASLLSPHARTLYPPISWFYLVLSVAHLYKIVKTLIASVQARQPVFRNRRRRTQINSTEPAISRPTSRWRRVYRSIFGRQGFFGAESPFFEFQFLMREVVEMLSQTSQVMLGSILIGRPWINHLLVAILFVNSWSTPAIQYVTHRFPALERVLCLTVDLALDLVMNLALSVVLVLPYFRAFNASNCSFDISVMYSDVGSVNLIMESRMVFVSGPIDLMLKLMPHLSIFFCLGSIQSLLKPEQVTTKQSNKTSEPSGRLDGSAEPSKSFLKAIAHSNAIVSDRIMHMEVHRLRGCKARLVHGGFLLWGLLVLAMHLKTAWLHNLAQEGTPEGCMQPLRPWFATKPACSVFRYSCLADNVTSPAEASLAALDERSLAALVLSDCAELRMPTVLQNFSGLLQLEVWQSNIVRWGPEAALTSRTNPNMVYCGIVRSTMREFPEGLLQQLPASLTDIEISHCNLSSLPDSLEIAWSNVKVLYVEYCNLSVLPTVLQRMNVADLSLIGNQLTALPVMTNNFFGLALGNNHLLASIPESPVEISKFAFLALENTAVAAIPSWIDAMSRRSDVKINMFGTPFCASKSTEEVNSKFGAEAALTCINTNPRVNGRYPLEFVETLRSGGYP